MTTIKSDGIGTILNSEKNEAEDKYKIGRVLQMSSKPILSVGTYESLDAECIIAGSSDRNIRFLEINSLDEIARCKVTKKSVNFVAVSEMSPEGDEPIIVTGGKDSVVQIWDPIEGTLVKSIQLPTNEVRSLAVYNGTEAYLVVGTKDSKVILWDIKKNVLVSVFVGHKASVHCVCITTCAYDLETQHDMDYMCIASGGADRTVRTWDLTTKKRKKKFRHKRSISTMVVASKGMQPILATGGVERVIKLWDIETGVLLRSLEGHLDQVNCLCLWEGYEMLLVSGSNDHTLRVFDMLTGECLCVLQGHTEAVLGASIANKDDPVLVSCSDDLSLIQWSLTDIICDFFCTEDDQLGTRNDRKPILPVLTYTAPPELDKDKVPKDERKRLRKEMKRLKRLKANAAVLQSISLAKRQMGLMDDDDDDDDEEDDEGGKAEEKWRGDGDDGDEENQEKEERCAEESNIEEPTVPITAVAGHDQSGEGPQEEEEGGEEDAEIEAEAVADIPPIEETCKEEGAVSSASLTQSLSTHSSRGSLQMLSRSLSNRVFPDPTPYNAAPGTSSESGGIAIVKALIGKVGRGLGLAGSEKVDAEPQPTETAAETEVLMTEEDGEEEAERGAEEGEEEEEVEVGLDEEEEEEEEEVGGQDEDSPTFADDNQAELLMEGDLLQQANQPSSPHLQQQTNSMSKNSTSKKSPPSKLRDSDLFRKHAEAATAKYSQATLAQEAEADRLRSKASEKLAQRLHLKRGTNNHTQPETSATTINTAAEESLHALKAEKLRQHKLQESRRNHSMALAKDRAKVMLQRRLDELAARKKGDEDDGNQSDDSF